jgi:AraC-like DNA-binding protein
VRPQNLISAEVPEGFLLTTAVVKAGAGARASGIPHAHPEPMIAWAHRGASELHLDGHVWLLTPGQGVIVPPEVVHAAIVFPQSILCCTYIADIAGTGSIAGTDRIVENPTPERYASATACAAQWQQVRAVRTEPVWRDLLVHLADQHMPRQRRLLAQQLVLDMLEQESAPAIVVPMPKDPRIADLARYLRENPHAEDTVEVLAVRFSFSARTINRAFVAELGMPLSRWRALVRIAWSVKLLSEGIPIGVVAHRVGFATASAFGTAFRRILGVSPSQYGARAEELMSA